MGLDDLTEGEENKVEREEVEDISEELGLDDLEDLREAEEQLVSMRQAIINHDKKIRQLEDEIEYLQTLLKELIREYGD